MKTLLRNAFVAWMLIMLTAFAGYSQTFTNVASSVGLATAGSKDAGVCWADFNNDGFLDLVVNTESSSSGSRLYFSNSGSTFTDVTGTNASELANSVKERSALAGDFNNDGYTDFLVNTFNRIEIWLNQGPSSTPAYSFGTSSQAPSQVISSISGGINAEGIVLVDYDNDGDIDLIVDDHGFGVDILSNNGAGQFSAVDNTITGLPTGGTTGDYAAAGDFNSDGFVDICVRRQSSGDLFINNGNGTFTEDAFNQNAVNNNKGGVLWADFDNDGDLDLFWTDSGTNQIWRNDNGTLVATGEPAASAGVNLSSANIDGITAGDIDKAAPGKVKHVLGGVLRQLIVAGRRQRIGQAGVGIGANESVGDIRQLFDERTHQLRTQRAVQTDGQRLRVPYRIPEGFRRLSR
jgi:hypothetical protein